MEDQTKKCPRCASDVGIEAKVCPQCHYSFRLHASRAVIAIVTLVVLLAIGGSVAYYVKWKADDRKEWDACQMRNNNRILPGGGRSSPFENC
jgi:hypothetical protein